MIVKAKSVIGSPIYTLKQGKRLENSVEDVVYDPQANRVEALVLDKGGWFSDTRVILLQDVHSIGDDVVLIQNDGVIKSADDVKPKVASIAKGENYLSADQVITEDGKDLGKISDLFFDSATGEVSEFEVSQGTLKNVGTGKKTIKVTDIIVVGEDAMIVGAYTAQIIEQQAQQKGLKGAMTQTKQKAPSIMEQVKQKTKELTGKTKEKAKEIKESPKTKEITQKTKEKTAQATDATKRTVQEGKGKVQGKRESDVLGRYLTINILSENDEILAARGEMVTHDLLKEAKRYDMMDQVLNNTTKEPLAKPSSYAMSGALGGKAKAARKKKKQTKSSKK